MARQKLRAQAKQDNSNVLKKFTPLNALSDARYTDVYRECLIEECAKGDILFA